MSFGLLQYLYIFFGFNSCFRDMGLGGAVALHDVYPSNRAHMPSMATTSTSRSCQCHANRPLRHGWGSPSSTCRNRPFGAHHLKLAMLGAGRETDCLANRCNALLYVRRIVYTFPVKSTHGVKQLLMEWGNCRVKMSNCSFC